MDGRRTTEIYDIKRNSHRVFRRIDSKADRFNPFRHIAWDISYEPELGLPSQHPTTEEQPSKRFKFLKNLKPERPFNVKNQIQRTLFVSWVNILLIFTPIGFILNSVTGPSVATFAVNFVAAIPLWFLCDYALEELQKWLGETAAGLLYVSSRYVLTRW